MDAIGCYFGSETKINNFEFWYYEFAVCRMYACIYVWTLSTLIKSLKAYFWLTSVRCSLGNLTHSIPFKNNSKYSEIVSILEMSSKDTHSLSLSVPQSLSLHSIHSHPMNNWINEDREESANEKILTLQWLDRTMIDVWNLIVDLCVQREFDSARMIFWITHWSSRMKKRHRSCHPPWSKR